MQVTFSTILPNSNAEPAASSNDSAEDSSGVSFFAQMGQIWNSQSEKDVPGEEKKAEPQSPADPSGNPIAALINACMLPVPEQMPKHPVLDAASFDGKHAETPADSKIAATLFEFDSAPVPAWGRTPANSNPAQSSLQLINSGLSTVFAGSAEDGNEAQHISASSAAQAGQDPVVEMAADKLTATPVLAETELFESQLLQEMPASASSLEPSVKGGSRQTAPEMSGTAVKAAAQMPDPADFVHIPAPDSSKEVSMNSESQPACGSTAKTDDPRMADNSGNISLKETSVSVKPSDASAGSKKADAISTAALREVLQNAAGQNRAESALAAVHPRGETRSESITASEKTGSVFDLRGNCDGVLRAESDQASAAGKRAIAAPAAVENEGTADARTGQENSRSDFAASMVFQNKATDIVRTDQNEPKVASEKLQEVSSLLTAGSARLNEASGTVHAPRPQTAGLQQREFIEQLAERIQVQVRDGKGEIRIQLKPDSLGHLEIRAESTVNGVVARIMAESGTVKNYLESNMHLLQQSLQDQGLRIDRIQVSVQDNSGSQSSSGYAAESGHSGSGNQGRSGSRSRSGEVSSAGQEELPVDPRTWAALNPNVRFHTIA
jgi:flagellar hook-length control protein FliK